MEQEVLKMIEDERARQDAQWGGPAHDDEHGLYDWFDFVANQIQRVGQELFARGEGYMKTPDAKQRLVKIAALAIAGLESHRRKS